MIICRVPIPDPRMEYPGYCLMGSRLRPDGVLEGHIHYRYSYVATCWQALRWWWQGYSAIAVQYVRPLTPEELASFTDLPS